jgi:hypothetical protein
VISYAAKSRKKATPRFFPRTRLITELEVCFDSQARRHFLDILATVVSDGENNQSNEALTPQTGRERERKKPKSRKLHTTIIIAKYIRFLFLPC